MINQLPQGLRTIVNLEYQAGNKVIQIGHHWPQSGKINVLLDKQFIAKYPYIPDVKYAEDLDPHNPIEMYFDINTGDCVFCSKFKSHNKWFKSFASLTGTRIKPRAP